MQSKMRNVIGQPARGDDFYPRKREVEKIERALRNRSNIQITAPRRVGKTSILWHFQDEQLSGRDYVYIDTEAIADENEFYRKLLSEILKCDVLKKRTGFWEKLRNGANERLKKIKSITIAGVGLELNDKEPHNYREELHNLLAGYAEEENSELVLQIDEFPITIENIRNAQGDNAAIVFLHGNRSLRMSPDISTKVRFIYTGSIGLNHTVARMDATATINDLNPISVEALSGPEALDLLEKLLAHEDRSILPEAGDHLLKMIEWYIPFHIQLIVQELAGVSVWAEPIDIAMVDQAIGNIVDQRYQSHFEHYYSRLKKQFKANSYSYALHILKEIAEKDRVDKARTFQLAQQNEVEQEYKHILLVLEYDGYIHLTSDNQTYRYNSPIVKRWWVKYYC